MSARVRGALVAVVSVTVMVSAFAQTVERPFRPVTDAMLLAPDPGDWINWRRTLDGWGYSPLKQITRDNVGALQLAWSRPMLAGADEATPLVYGGVMYLPSPTGIQALDAATGEPVWEYKKSGVARRNIAIYADKILGATADAHLFALQAQTGTLVWDHPVADHGLGYEYTSGPIVVKGRVVAGMTGCTRYKEDVCFISAHDVATGKELWRTSTVARPGEPGGDTWGGLPLTFRAGSDAWIPGSYDPATDLIYWGTAQAKPWASAQRGTDAPSLFTNSTLALDPDTGRIAWYFQHIPGEAHDMDEVFESILIDNGPRQSLFKMGKIGVLWELDRKTGRFLNGHDLGYQTLLTVDAKTGAVAYRPGVVPKLNEAVEYCPGTGGFKNLFAMAYHPDTHAFYIPLKLSCTRSIFSEVPRVKGGGGPGGAKRTAAPHPASPNEMGEFLAMDSRTGKILWRHRSRLPYDTAALTTAGGLVFVGDIEGNFFAFDVATGDRRWQTRTPMPLDGFPITYTVRGRQYLAVPSGPGWFVAWTHIHDVLPDYKRPTGNAMMHVFALPAPSLESRQP